MGHSHRCEVVPHSGLVLSFHFPDSKWWGASLHMPVGLVYIFLALLHPPFWLGLSLFIVLSSADLGLSISFQIYCVQICSSIQKGGFCFSDSVFHCAEAFKKHVVPIVYSLLCFLLLEAFTKTSLKIMLWSGLPIFFLSTLRLQILHLF